MGKRRRKLLVDWRFQVRYLMLTLGLMIVVSAGLVWVTFYVNWRLLSRNYPQLLVGSDLYQVFHQTSGAVFWTTLSVMLAAIVVGGTLALVASQRIAGPLLRFKRVAQSIANGNTVNEIKFRRKDELPGTEKDINKIIKAVNELQLKNSGMNKEISAIREKLSSDLGREMISRENLSATVHQLEEIVAKFAAPKAEQRR